MTTCATTSQTGPKHHWQSTRKCCNKPLRYRRTKSVSPKLWNCLRVAVSGERRAYPSAGKNTHYEHPTPVIFGGFFANSGLASAASGRSCCSQIAAGVSNAVVIPSFCRRTGDSLRASFRNDQRCRATRRELVTIFLVRKLKFDSSWSS